MKLGMNRCTADGDRLQAAQVPAPHVRMVEHPRDHGRDRAPARDLPLLDQIERVAGIELAARHHQRVADDDGAQQGLHSTDVEQRSGVQGDVSASIRPPGAAAGA